ncbi:acyltransferase [uncultured Acetobacteroides sp.]|uniref:acyltransferase n=1 Tax=uncultured Acetobacteroides sp. TaxID=1760811 RepID=UPI0029F59AEB|nr:acyltransferase [uncultured Acetobacteroides sp.]
MSSFLSEIELAEMGFKSVGSNVLISRKASFYGADKMSIGSNVRIDDFCILSGTITLGNSIHIAAYSAIYGANGVVMEDYTGLSPRCTIFSAMDDFGGDYLISPMSKSEYTNVQGGLVTIKRYSQIGSSTTIFPNLTIGEGVAVGAMSLVCSNLSDWGIYFGIPAKYHKPRSKGLLKFVSNEG